MDRAWVVDLVEKLPQAMVSRAWGWLARRRSPRLGVGLLKRTFVKAVGIDMSEAAESMGHYATLEDLFVRTLRPGARRIDPAPDAVVSPVDGTVGACGVVTEGTCFQVKGRAYNLGRLLDDHEEAKRFEGGAYATLYLAPKDYHRIHAPVAGSVSKATLVPGALMPVFVEALHRVDELFARNERVITYLDSATAGRVAVVKVGATLVGRISVAYDPEVRTNLEGQLRRSLAYDPPHLIQKGGELGAFELGSTVVVIAEPQRLSFEELTEGASVRMGERIGSLALSKKRNTRRAGDPAEADAPARGQR